jgi:protein-L-isoaspartate(D-aspartate) O-methyltransferase
MTPIEEHRRFYAQFVVRSAGATDERLMAAFATVPREDYVGPGPWPVFVGAGYLPTPSADPRWLYQDVLIGLAPERGINNGQPSLHARCLAAAAPMPGETVIHIGAGTGYYSALLATLVGPNGRVTAYEVEADLAARAADTLRATPQVTVVNASATAAALPEAHVIYVSAGATHPLPHWLDALAVGGRLVFPLTPIEGMGVMLKLLRLDAERFAAEALFRAAFIPCLGARNDAASASLTAALERQTLKSVRSLRCNEKPDGSAWCVGDGWWLSTAPPTDRSSH